jgi:hypothetical protein
MRLGPRTGFAIGCVRSLRTQCLDRDARQAHVNPEPVLFCLWEGYGYLTGAVAVLTAHFRAQDEPKALFQFNAPIRPPRPKLKKSRVRLPNRDYLLFTDSVQQGESWEDGPNPGGLTTAGHQRTQRHRQFLISRLPVWAHDRIDRAERHEFGSGVPDQWITANFVKRLTKK